MAAVHLMLQKHSLTDYLISKIFISD